MRGDVHEIGSLQHECLDSCQRRDCREGGRQAVEVDACLEAPREQLLTTEAATSDELIAGKRERGREGEREREGERKGNM